MKTMRLQKFVVLGLSATLLVATANFGDAEAGPNNRTLRSNNHDAQLRNSIRSRTELRSLRQRQGNYESFQRSQRSADRAADQTRRTYRRARRR